MLVAACNGDGVKIAQHNAARGGNFFKIGLAGFKGCGGRGFVAQRANVKDAFIKQVFSVVDHDFPLVVQQCGIARRVGLDVGNNLRKTRQRNVHQHRSPKTAIDHYGIDHGGHGHAFAVDSVGLRVGNICLVRGLGHGVIGAGQLVPLVRDLGAGGKVRQISAGGVAAGGGAVVRILAVIGVGLPHGPHAEKIRVVALYAPQHGVQNISGRFLPLGQSKGQGAAQAPGFTDGAVDEGADQVAVFSAQGCQFPLCHVGYGGGAAPLDLPGQQTEAQDKDERNRNNDLGNNAHLFIEIKHIPSLYCMGYFLLILVSYICKLCYDSYRYDILRIKFSHSKKITKIVCL